MTGLITLKPAYVPYPSSSTDKPDWKVVGVLLTGTFLAVLDFFIVNVAVPELQRDLDASVAQIQLIVAGYALAYGSVLIAGSRLGDIYGRRRMFILGLVLLVQFLPSIRRRSTAS